MPEETKQTKEVFTKELTKEIPTEEIKKTDDLRSLIEKNIKWSQVIYEQNRKINRRLTFMVVGDYLKLLLVLGPLIAALIFLPPLFKQIWQEYSSLLQGGASVNSGDQIKSIINGVSGQQLQEVLKMIQTK